MSSIESGIVIGVNKTQYMNGYEITVEAKSFVADAIILGDTAIHEAEHAVAARLGKGTGVKSVTIRPGAGYLGLTQLSGFDAAAAAAPHAMGRKGTGHDMAIIEFSGHDRGAAISAGRSIIEKNKAAVVSVASLLEEKGTIGGSEVDSAILSAGKPKKDSAVVIIKSLDGKEQRINSQSEDGVVMIPGEWIEFAKAA